MPGDRRRRRPRPTTHACRARHYERQSEIQGLASAWLRYSAACREPLARGGPARVTIRQQCRVCCEAASAMRTASRAMATAAVACTAAATLQGGRRAQGPLPHRLRGGGGGGGGAARRKRFAWELDGEALANGYVWEGVPAWQDAADSAEACGGPRARWAAAGLGGEHARACALDVIGGGRNALHDPDQFSLWRKGWMATAMCTTADPPVVSQAHPAGEDASSDWSGDAVEPRAAAPAHAPRGGARQGGHTGLPQGDRIVLLLLLLHQCAAPPALGLFGLCWREVRRPRVSVRWRVCDALPRLTPRRVPGGQWGSAFHVEGR